MISFLQSATDTADLSSYTFASQNLGSAASDRHIIVAVISRKAGATTTITGVTVGGVAATIVRQRANTASNTQVAGLAIALVPSGTTGDVVVTFADTMVRCSIGLYRADDLLSATPYDVDDSVVADPTVNLDILAGGFAIGVGGVAASTTATWTGLTEDYDAVSESFMGYTGAHDEFSASESGRTITIDFGTTTENVGVFASWAYAGIHQVSRVDNGSVSAVGSIQTPAQAHTAGNLLVALISRQNPNAITVTDTDGNTWQQLGSDYQEAGNTNVLAIWYAYNIGGHASNQVTAALTSGTGGYFVISVREFRGFGTEDPGGDWDGADGNGTTPTTASLAVTGDEAVIVAIVEADGQSIVAGSGFTGENIEAIGFFLDEYKIVTAGEEADATCASNDWRILGGVFNAPSGAAGTLSADMYEVVQRTTISIGAAYEVTNNLAVMKDLDYAVESEHNSPRDLDYAVMSEHPITKDAEYAVSDELVLTKDAEYQVTAEVADTKGADYRVLTTPGEMQIGADYAVTVEMPITKGAVYMVVAEVPVTKAADYEVTAEVALTKGSQYAVTVSQDVTKGMDYEVEIPITTTNLQKDAQYAVQSEQGVAIAAAYEVTVELAIQKAIEYMVTQDQSITKDAEYRVVVERVASIGADYEVTSEASITKPSAYRVITEGDVTKGMLYEVTSEQALQKGTEYAVQSVQGQSKASDYFVKTEGVESKWVLYKVTAEMIEIKTMEYEVTADVALTKPMSYEVQLNTSIEKEMEYRVTTDTAIQVPMTYVVRFYPYTRKPVRPYTPTEGPYAHRTTRVIIRRASPYARRTTSPYRSL